MSEAQRAPSSSPSPSSTAAEPLRASAATPVASEGLTLATLFAYSLPAVAVNFSFVLFVSFYSKYAVDVLLVAPAAIGLIFGAGRLFDAVIDPFLGVWSDRTQHAWGRRRPWLAVSALPMAVVGWMVWSPPASLAGFALTAWVAIAVFAFNIVITLFLIPHQALGAELTTDSHEVSRVFAWRQAATYVGMIGCLVFGMPALMRSSEPRGLATTYALVCGAVILVTVAISVALLREPVGNRRRAGVARRSVARDLWRNRYSRSLLAMVFIEHVGSGASMVVAPFLIQYVLKLPDRTGAVFVFYVGSSLLSLPLWVWLARRIGKKATWFVGLALGIVGYASLFVIGEGQLAWMQMVVTLTGSSSACGNVIAQSLLADVVDVDELETGERKEGAYYSTYTFLLKASSGVMAMVTGFTLTTVGFIPNDPAPSELVRTAIRSLNSLPPLISLAIGAIMLIGFGLTAEKHAEVRRELDARRATAAPPR